MSDPGPQISWEQVEAALVAESKARGWCWCAVPLRALIDVRGSRHAVCLQLITDESYQLTPAQRGEAVTRRLSASA